MSPRKPTSLQWQLEQVSHSQWFHQIPNFEVNKTSSIFSIFPWKWNFSLSTTFCVWENFKFCYLPHFQLRFKIVLSFIEILLEGSHCRRQLWNPTLWNLPNAQSSLKQVSVIVKYEIIPQKSCLSWFIYIMYSSFPLEVKVWKFSSIFHLNLRDDLAREALREAICFIFKFWKPPFFEIIADKSFRSVA